MSSRVAQVRAGIPHTVPLSTVNRQCSSGLQAVAHVAAGIKCGHYAIGIAAGESMAPCVPTIAMLWVDAATTM